LLSNLIHFSAHKISGIIKAFILVISPVIPTRTKAILEMMEAISIPYHNFSFKSLGDELNGCVAVTTHAQVLKNLDGCTSWGAYKPKRNS
jgi:hypothetical protein